MVRKRKRKAPTQEEWRLRAATNLDQVLTFMKEADFTRSDILVAVDQVFPQKALLPREEK